MRIMKAMMKTEANPCEDFWTYATGNGERTFWETYRNAYFKSLLENAGLSNQFQSIRSVRDIYARCNQSGYPTSVREYNWSETAEYMKILFGKVKLPLTKDSAIIQSATSYQNLVARIYNALFHRGIDEIFSNIFTDHRDGKLTFRFPEDSLEDEKKIWELYCNIVKNCNKIPRFIKKPIIALDVLKERQKEFLEVVFGTKVRMENMTVMWPTYYGKQTMGLLLESRAYVVNKLFVRAFDNQVYYKSCEHYITKNFPLFMVKLAIDDMKSAFKDFRYMKDEFFMMVNLILDEAKQFVRSNKILEANAIEKLSGLFDKNTFAFIDHPFFNDQNFHKYAGTVNSRFPSSAKYANNYLPFVFYENDNGGRHLRLPTAEINAFHIEESQANIFEFGLFHYPFYQPSWPVALTFSGLGFVVAHELGHTFLKQQGLSQSLRDNYQCLLKLYADRCNPDNPAYCVNPARTYEENIADQLGIRFAYAAFNRYVSFNRSTYHIPNRSLSAYNDQQLFFINTAQLIAFMNPTWAAYSQGSTHAPTQARVWGIMANFAGFANAFSCREGDNYAVKDGCKVFVEDLKGDPNVFAGYTQIPG
ncbi:unnamed protein product [Bursaphelenchus xylophilus]|uniref:(pine wood nematode) hypothetical protein n=1 Tax=Bursaphelenchus xylophilus TaxID=6326 RepID=A0A1I7S6Q8_BURXY|nr:unnamed protein product [Bursaphelenchus xylophilus]CAG9120686.1 unnamed protein product [Bursaphelenchus xylophilus]